MRDQDWTASLRNVIRDVDELLALVGVPRSALAADLAPAFPVRVPRSFASRMRYGDAADPLLRQVLPLAAENVAVPGFCADPLDEASAMVAPGLIQKYASRLLLITAGDCAVHCRYCFRRNFPYSEHRLSVEDESLAAIRADPSITEVIASGGDPLMLTDAHFARLCDALESICLLYTSDAADE